MTRKSQDKEEESILGKTQTKDTFGLKLFVTGNLDQGNGWTEVK